MLLVKDINYRTGKLDRELMYLLNKAKYYVPKTKPTGKFQLIFPLHTMRRFEYVLFQLLNSIRHHSTLAR